MNSHDDAVANDVHCAGRRLSLAVLISIGFHLVLLSVLDLQPEATNPAEASPEEPPSVLFVFPENEPRQVVENSNPNDVRPDESDLLSERNSSARNEDPFENTGQEPRSLGDVSFSNLSYAASEGADDQIISDGNQFSDATAAVPAKERGIAAANQIPDERKTALEDLVKQMKQSSGTGDLYNQTDHSVDAAGALTLSTYAWEWAPYVNYFKKKLYSVWHAPPAYYNLRLIHGQTVIHITISQEGKLLSSRVLSHEGHSSLLASSESAINAVFPLKPLPPDFPDLTLTIVLTLHYPDLSGRRDRLD